MTPSYQKPKASLKHKPPILDSGEIVIILYLEGKKNKEVLKMKLVPYRRYEMRPWWLSADRNWIDEFFSDVMADDENRSRFMPSVDIKENKKNLVVKAEIPGMDAKDIDLTLEKDMLIISGERSEEKEEEDENYYRKETFSGSFRRALKLPVDVEADKIKADYKNGVLKVTLPKANGKAAKAITVEAH